MTPFWGPVTSTVDWCEANYEVSRFVAEPWNTVSSLAMVVVGIYGLVRHRGIYRLAFALLSLVGVGSIAFHATLKRGLQMLDELPMLYLVVVIVYVLVATGAPPRRNRRIAMGLAAYAIGLTLMTSLTRGTLQFSVFHVTFGSLELFALTKVYLLQRTAPPSVRRLYAAGMTVYALAVIAWIVDTRACATVAAMQPRPQLHAAWHVLVSLGFYVLLRVIATTLGRS